MARIHTGVWALAVPVLMLGGVSRGDEVVRGLELLEVSGAELERLLAVSADAQRVLLDAQTRAIMLEQARAELQATLWREALGELPVVEDSVDVPGPGVGVLTTGAGVLGLRRRR